MKPASLIHAVPGIFNEASGPSYSVVRLCESLVDWGLDVTLAALDWGPIAFPPPFLRTFTLGVGPLRLGRSPSMKRWLDSEIDNASVDLIHCHSLWMMPNVYPGWASRRSGVPLVVSPRGTLSEWAFGSGSSSKRWFWPLIQKPALRATSCFHATAMSEYEDLRRLGFRQPIAVIPNGIDIPKITTKSPAADRTLLFLGRIHPKKGLDLLLPAWKVVQDCFPAWRLRIVGPDNGGYQAQMKALAKSLSLKRIEFSGPMFGEAKWHAYQNADLFVLPTYSENFGMAVAEALAAGTPAIVTQGAPWEGLESHHSGSWVETNVDALISALKDLMACDPEHLTMMGLNGRAWMEAEFSWRHIGRRMMKTYEWLLHGGEKPSWILEH